VDGYGVLLVAHTVLDEDKDGEAVEIFRIISAEPPIGWKGDDMKKQLVGYESDLANLPPLTHAERAELSALPARPDTEIDYTRSR
jgi:hypothetical protein